MTNNKKANILIVDDDHDYIGKIAYLLKSEGYKVGCVSTLEQVKSKLQRARIDLICLDVELDESKIDGMNWGLDFTTVIGEAEKKNIHVILITAHQAYEDRIRKKIKSYKTVAKRIFFKQDLDRKELVTLIKKILMTNHKASETTRNTNNQGGEPMTSRTQQRLKDLEKNLQSLEKKRGFFQNKLVADADQNRQFQMQEDLEKIESEIQQREVEYAKLVADEFDNFLLSDAEAEEVVLALLNATDQKSLSAATDQPQDVAQAIVKVQETLKKPDVTAKNKLKMTLPLIPGILSYELEVDPVGLLSKTWQTIKTKFKR